jgi:hypothetical protein
MIVQAFVATAHVMACRAKIAMEVPTVAAFIVLKVFAAIRLVTNHVVPAT